MPMSNNENTDSFYFYFQQNMEAMGLPVPESLFTSFTTAIASTTTLVEALKKFGPRVTVLELIHAGFLTEKLKVIGAMTASFYVGAVIGSLFIAAQKQITGGKDLIDVLNFSQFHGIDFDELTGVLHNFPGFFDTRVSERWSYTQKAAVNGITVTC
jgi:hypothetical protein